MELIRHYFELTELQDEHFAALIDLYSSWNSRINLVSRKDFEHFYERHVLHSLSIAKLGLINDSKVILDLGSGGGFPGIPLAIFYPEKKFLLCDSIAKKMKAVEDIQESLSLDNVTCVTGRAEHVVEKYDTVIVRAVAKMEKLVSFVNIKSCKKIVALKGGDLTDELKDFKESSIETYDISQLFDRPFFETKKVVVHYL